MANLKLAYCLLCKAYVSVDSFYLKLGGACPNCGKGRLVGVQGKEVGKGKYAPQAGDKIFLKYAKSENFQEIYRKFWSDEGYRQKLGKRLAVINPEMLQALYYLKHKENLGLINVKGW